MRLPCIAASGGLHIRKWPDSANHPEFSQKIFNRQNQSVIQAASECHLTSTRADQGGRNDGINRFPTFRPKELKRMPANEFKRQSTCCDFATRRWPTVRQVAFMCGCGYENVRSPECALGADHLSPPVVCDSIGPVGRYDQRDRVAWPPRC